jgi:hypothetical protein
MPAERGTLSGSRGLMFLYVSLPCLTPSEQLAACDALIDLAAIEIASHMTLENVIDEIFCDPPPYVPFPALVDYVADNRPSPAKVLNRGVEIIRENRGNVRIRSQLQKILEGAASGESSGNFAAFSACFSGLFR